jgi:hypothetical protein
MRSYSIATVRDLRRKIHAVIGERRRTKANETEIETIRVLQLTTSSAGKRRRKLAQPAQYDPLATLAIAPRPRRPRNGAARHCELPWRAPGRNIDYQVDGSDRPAR